MKIIISLIFFSFVFADIKIYTKSLNKRDNIIYLDSPLILYNHKILQSNKGKIYKNRTIELEGNVTVFNRDYFFYTPYLKTISKNHIKFASLFLYDRKFDGWIKSHKANYIKDIIYFNKLYVSTCCIKNPDWFIKSYKAKYYKSSKELDLYNVILVVNNIPILYLPYLHLNFNKNRRSGLLKPYFGYSQIEGFLYSQPIYIVTAINNDLEIIPTIRTKRGKGIYSIFRFIDSPYSNGNIKFGYFKDRYKFYNENNLANKEHYGYEIQYTRDFSTNEKLYLNIKYANDVDYFYLDAKNYKFLTNYLSDRIITSTLNYINYNKKNFLGIMSDYFVDTSKKSNKDTWQIVPDINYHYFLNKRSNILYSFDANIYNYSREEGSNFVLSKFYLPISFYHSYKYVKVKLNQIFDFGYGKYYENISENSYYINSYAQLKLYSSFIKHSKYFYHIILPSIIYSFKEYSKKRINNNNLMNMTNKQDYITFSFYEELKYKDFILSHNLNNTYYIFNRQNSLLENRLSISYRNLNIYDNNKFSFSKNRTEYNSFSISYSFSKLKTSIEHIFQNKISESINYKVSYYPNSKRKFYFETGYDLINKYYKYFLLGSSYNVKCFRYNLSIKQQRIPSLKETGISFRKDNILNVNIVLYPIAGFNQTFIFKGNN